MKIYRIARVFDYMDVAHGRDKVHYLWAIINGQLKVAPTMEDGIPNDHYEQWGGELGDDEYFGRFDPYKKTLSINNPFEGRAIPSVIMKQLYDQFGSDIKVMEFS